MFQRLNVRPIFAVCNALRDDAIFCHCEYIARLSSDSKCVTQRKVQRYKMSRSSADIRVPTMLTKPMRLTLEYDLGDGDRRNGHFMEDPRHVT